MSDQGNNPKEELLRKYRKYWEKMVFLSNQNAFLQKILDNIDAQAEGGLPLYIQDVVDKFRNQKGVDD